MVSELNASRYGTRDSYDAATLGNHRIPGRWVVNDETSAMRATHVVSTYDAAVSDADLALPQQRRMLVEYPPGVSRVVLPSRFEPREHVIVRATINGRGLDFILDTGSSGITLDQDVAYDLRLTMVARHESSGKAGASSPASRAYRRWRLAGCRCAIRSSLGVEKPNVKSVGLIGFDRLCESGITIDYERETVTAERYGSYRPPTDPRTIAIAVPLRDQVPETTMTIDGAVAERVLVDTGAVGPR